MPDRFSLRYLDRGTAAADSPRARLRIASRHSDVRTRIGPDKSTFDMVFVDLVHSELGVKVASNDFGYFLHDFLLTCQLRDFLDSITLLIQALHHKPWWKDRAPGFREFVQRVFDEENLCYSLGADDVVVYRVDSEFESNAESAIAVLEQPQFGQVRAAFARAREDFQKPTPDTIDGIRSLFEAAESLFKIVTGSKKDLDESEVKKSLIPFVDRKLKDADAVAKSSAGRFAHGFVAWVNAAHPYRHGHVQPEPVVPPLHFAVALMSTGAAYIRWIATLENT